MSEYIRNVVASSVHHFARAQVGNSRRMIELARQFLPYALFRRDDGRLLVLNREYKPLGWPPRHREWVDYEADELRLLTLPGDRVAPSSDRMSMLWDSPSPWRTAEAAAEYRRLVAGIFQIKESGEDGDNVERAAA